MRNIRWIMWLTLSCSHSSCLDRKERLISATESSLSSTLSDTEFSDSDWLSPESSTVIKVWLLHARITLMLLLHWVIGTLLYGFLWWHTLWLLDHCNDPHKHWLYFFYERVLINLLTWCFSRRLLWFLTWCKLLGISQWAEEGSKGVAGDVLVVVALVSHLTGAQHLFHPRSQPSGTMQTQQLNGNGTSYNT